MCTSDSLDPNPFQKGPGIQKSKQKPQELPSLLRMTENLSRVSFARKKTLRFLAKVLLCLPVVTDELSLSL